jgi:hypothetical protein
MTALATKHPRRGRNQVMKAIAAVVRLVQALTGSLVIA